MFNCKSNLNNNGFSRTETILVSSLTLIIVAVLIAFVVGGLTGTSKDSNVIESMRSLRKESEIFYLENSRSYKDFCLTEVVDKLNRKADDFVCFNTTDGNSFGMWAAEYKLETNEKYYCADYTGKDGFALESSISHEDFVCDIDIKKRKTEDDKNEEKVFSDYLK